MGRRSSDSQDGPRGHNQDQDSGGLRGGMSRLGAAGQGGPIGYNQDHNERKLGSGLRRGSSWLICAGFAGF